MTAAATLKEYKSITRSTKEAWTRSQATALMNNYYNHPKSFWSAVRNPKYLGGEGFTIDAWSSYFSELLKEHECSSLSTNVDDLVGNVNHANLVESASQLNRDFSVVEVACVLNKLRRGTSPGIDGIPAEFFRYGFNNNNHKFCQVITHIFNRALKEGCPSSWTSSAVTPVPKPKGDCGVMDNYRGIVVSNSLSKIYSLCLLARLDSWVENNRLRAVGQSGFRLTRGTTDSTFILNHLIYKYRSERKTSVCDFC